MNRIVAILFLLFAGIVHACPVVPSPPPGTWAAPSPFVKNPMVACTWQNAATVPREYLGEVFSNSATGVGYPQITWNDIDITTQSGGVVPRNAVAALVSGILVITNVSTATNAQTSYADLEVTFRAPGDVVTDPECNYSAQTFTPFSNDGMRSTFSQVMPLVNGHTQFYWSPVQPSGVWNGINQAPYFAINATVQMICVP